MLTAIDGHSNVNFHLRQWTILRMIKRIPASIRTGILKAGAKKELSARVPDNVCLDSGYFFAGVGRKNISWTRTFSPILRGDTSFF